MASTQDNKKGNICFKCTKALGGCSWSRSFTPVPGWDATPDGAYGGYTIRACPEFVPDPPKETKPPAELTKKENQEFLEQQRVERLTDARYRLWSSWVAQTADPKPRKKKKR